jgi:hypothetical protein
VFLNRSDLLGCGTCGPWCLHRALKCHRLTLCLHSTALLRSSRGVSGAHDGAWPLPQDFYSRSGKGHIGHIGYIAVLKLPSEGWPCTGRKEQAHHIICKAGTHEVASCELAVRSWVLWPAIPPGCHQQPPKRSLTRSFASRELSILFWLPVHSPPTIIIHRVSRVNTSCQVQIPAGLIEESISQLVPGLPRPPGLASNSQHGTNVVIRPLAEGGTPLVGICRQCSD